MTWTDLLRERSSTEEWGRHGNDSIQSSSLVAAMANYLKFCTYDLDRAHKSSEQFRA